MKNIISPNQIISGTSNPSFSQLVAALSPSAWFRCDDTTTTLIDTIAANNGLWSFTPTAQIGAVKGDTDGSVRLVQASSQAGQMADNAAFSADPLLTLAVWVRVASLPGNMLIVGKRTSGNQSEYNIHVQGDGTVMFECSPSGFDAGNISVITTDVLVIGEWAFVQARYDGTNISIRINKGAWVNTAYATGIFSGTGVLDIGRLSLENVWYFDGWVDEVIIVQDAVTTSDLDDIYDASAKTKVTITGVTQPGANRALFATSVAVYNSFGDETTFAPFEVDAGGLGYISPTVVQATLDLEYAVDPATGNAWRILTDMPTGTLSFAADETQHYLKVPSSGTVA